MAIPVKLQVFEGPLDLLLHLIEKNKVDIYDIPISLITKQYLQYIRQMEKEDMNVMSEFLVMAATLLDIKCKMLLPREKDEEGEEEDPRAELVARLIEYKLYKYMSYELKDRQVDAARAVYKKPSLPKEVLKYQPPIDYARLVGDINLARLQEIFKSVMKRQEDKIDPIRSTYGRIEKDEISLEEKIIEVYQYGSEHGQFSFVELLSGQDGKLNMIVTFLAVLEMIKISVFTICQEEIFDDIFITFHDDVPAPDFGQLELSAAG